MQTSAKATPVRIWRFDPEYASGSGLRIRDVPFQRYEPNCGKSPYLAVLKNPTKIPS